MGIGSRQREASAVWSERGRAPTIAVEVIAMLSDRELRELVVEHLKEEIAAKLHEGASRAQVVAALVEEGFARVPAETFVDAVMRGPFPKRPG
ncbi:MAG TPA: hypothetical protein VFP13_02410 [Actinomycetota bacterium]|nr:hypothetical protein [Actinomycetota bacterium]